MATVRVKAGLSGRDATELAENALVLATIGEFVEQTQHTHFCPSLQNVVSNLVQGK